MKCDLLRRRGEHGEVSALAGEISVDGGLVQRAQQEHGAGGQHGQANDGSDDC